MRRTSASLSLSASMAASLPRDGVNLADGEQRLAADVGVGVLGGDEQRIERARVAQLG